MPQSNVTKLVKKEVKKEERKAHGKRAPRINRAKQRKQSKGMRPTRGAGKQIVAKLNAAAAGASAERRQSAELAKMLCCPNLYDSFAVQDGFNSQPVGVASPYMVFPATNSTVGGTAVDGLGIAASDCWAFAYRDVHRCLQWYDPNPRTYKYTAIDDTGNTTLTVGANNAIDFIDAWNVNSGLDVYGSKLYTGVVREGRGAGARWTTGNKLQYIEITGVTPSVARTAIVQYMNGDEVYQGALTATATAGGIVTFNWSAFAKTNAGDPALPNFFHWKLVQLDGAITNGQISFGAVTQPVLRQYSLAQFQFLNAIVDKLRFNALSLMYSNTASELYRGGYAAAWQVPSNLDNHQLMINGFDALSIRPGAMRIEGNNGAHCFWKSVDIEDWRFDDVGEAIESSNSGGNYIIDTDSDYLALCMNFPDVNQRPGYWSVFTAVEYRHNSVWFPQTRPNHTRRVFEDALEMQGQVPMLHCNPFHIKDIFKWIGAHKNQIKDSVTMGASMLGPRAEGYANRANSFLDIWFK